MTAQNLPIWAIMADVLNTVRRGNNLVLTAPPGSGKTTQVPQALLDNNLIKGTILVIQPRRVACRAAARRIAEERETEIGNEIGYIVRHDGKRSAATRILFITDGVLLRFLERDPALSWVGAVVFDEFHERRAMTDVALGLLREAQLRRPSLRLIAMSATMESAAVVTYLNATLLSAEGRCYPVEVRHFQTDNFENTIKAVAPRIASLHAMGTAGDILAFLPGKEEIGRVEKALAALKIAGLVVLPLHGELTREAQDQVFKPVIGRKVVLATNIAETSVTIPGVRTVIDTGYERRADFDPALGMNRLTLMRISKASAEQRGGRAGREAPGICVRLWSREEHSQLVDYAPVEMQRTDLASIILTLKSLDFLDVASFKFIDPPDSERLALAEQYLLQLGAVGEDRRLTNVGWRMLRLPLPPRYARMVVESERSGCLKEIASIAALMAGRPILMTAAKDEQSEGAKIRFARDDSSDFFSLLNMFLTARNHRWSKQWCHEAGINSDALLEALLLRRKIIHVAFARGAPQTGRRGNPAAIRRCILTGLVDRIAQQQSKREYMLANGLACKLDESTVVRGRLLAVADVRLMRQQRDTNEPTGALGFVTRIDTHMLAQVAPHLLTQHRLPLAFDAALGQFTFKKETRYQELVIESEEKQVDLVDAFPVIAEQKERAKRFGWHRVNVLPGMNRKSHVIWEGNRVPVTADAAGPHWATVYGTRSPRVLLRERIIVIPGMEDKPSPLPAGLTNRLQRLSPALATLLGKR